MRILNKHFCHAQCASAFITRSAAPVIEDFPPAQIMNAEERKKQVGGNHYKDFAIQPWDIILLYKLDFWEGNALKYILRHKTDRLEDLKKARHYLDEAIRQRESVKS